MDLTRVRPLLLDRRAARHRRAGQLRGGQHVPRRTRRASAPTRPAGDLARLGPVGRGERAERPPHRGRPAAVARCRAAAPARRRGDGAVRRGCPNRRRGTRRDPAWTPPRCARGTAGRRLIRAVAGAQARARQPPSAEPGGRHSASPAGRGRPTAAADRDSCGRRWPWCSATPTPEPVDGDRPLPGSGLRLADRGRAAQPARCRHRTAPAYDVGVRPPDTDSRRRVPARPGGGGRASSGRLGTRHARPAAGRAARGRRRRHPARDQRGSARTARPSSPSGPILPDDLASASDDDLFTLVDELD